jgi:WD40 repeat protein
MLTLPGITRGQQNTIGPLEGTVIRRLGDTAWRVPFWPEGQEFSRDGKTLAVTGPYHLCLLDAATGKMTLSEKRDGGSIWQIAWGSGDTLYAAGQYHHVSRWHAGTRGLMQEYKWHKSVIRRLSISANATRLASMDVSHHVAVWEVPGGRLIRTFTIEGVTWPDAVISPDGKMLAASGSEKQPIVLYDVESGEKKPELPDGKGAVNIKLAFTPDGRRLIAGGQGPIFVWDLADAKLLYRITNVNEDHVEGLAVSPDGNYVATVGWGEAVHVWNLQTGKLHRSLIAPGDRLKGVAYSPDGTTVVACGGHSVVHRWRMDTGERLDAGPGHLGSVEAAVWLPSGRIVTAGKDRSIRVWAANSGQLEKTASLAQAIVPRTFSIDGTKLLGLSEQRLHLLDAVTGKEMMRENVRVAWDAQLAFHPDGGSFAYIVDSKALHVRSIHQQGKTRVLTPLPRPLNALEFSPDGKLLAAGFNQEYKPEKLIVSANERPPPRISLKRPTLVLYDVNSGEKLAQFGEELASVARLAFSPCGRYLAIGTDGNEVHVWDLKRRAKIAGKTEGHTTPTFLAFSADSRRLATVERMTGNGVFVLEVASMAPVAHCRGHDGQHVAAVFSPDGRRLVTTGLDTLALIWDVTGVAPDGALPRLKLDADELQRLWDNLASAEPAVAHRAVWRLVASGDRAVAFLKQRLKATPHADAAQVKKWLDDLDSGEFKQRKEAETALKRLEGAVEDDLRRRLEKSVSLEARRRLEQLLARLGPTPTRLRSGRAIWALEQIGTAGARDVLAQLASGDPRDAWTQDAEASLSRLAKRH